MALGTPPKKGIGTHVGGHVVIGVLVCHDTAAFRVRIAPQEGAGGHHDYVRVLVHADREGATAYLGIISGAREVAGSFAELIGVVGVHAAEALIGAGGGEAENVYIGVDHYWYVVFDGGVYFRPPEVVICGSAFGRRGSQTF